MLMAKECVLFRAFSNRTAAPLRAAHVGSPSDALSLPWIKGLPGEKRIRFFHGEVFAIQCYLGFKLVRAHICHVRERPGEAPGGKAPSCDCLPSVSDALGWAHWPLTHAPRRMLKRAGNTHPSVIAVRRKHCKLLFRIGRPSRDDLFHLAVGIDDYRQGNGHFIGGKQSLDVRDAADVNRIVDWHPLQELLHSPVRVGVDVEPYQVHTVSREGGAQSVQLRHFFQTRHTPCRPQIDDGPVTRTKYAGQSGSRPRNRTHRD